jgi:hypothetical protein
MLLGLTIKLPYSTPVSSVGVKVQIQIYFPLSAQIKGRTAKARIYKKGKR